MNNSYIPCAIITIGDELLIGQTIDTNSAWIAQEVRKIGFSVKQRLAVGDNSQDIVQSLEDAKRQSTVIFITGGLGPTLDDITKQTIATYFHTSLILHEPTLKKVEHFFKAVNMPLTDRNIQQAYLPKECIPIPNEVGTAPGMWFDEGNKIFIFMPGVPSEMKQMMINTIIPQLSQKYHSTIVDKYITTIGQYESFLADRLQQFEIGLPHNMSLAYLPNAFGFIKLRLTAYNESVEMIDSYFEKLKDLLSDCIVTIEDKTMVQLVAELLKKNHQTVSTAESCTGGYIAHLFTAMSGASSYFWGSVVSYDTSVKSNVLQVKKKTILEKTVVSEDVAIEMMKGVLKILHTDYAIAVTGIMEPNNNMEKNPMGRVCVAVGNNTNYTSKTFHFRGSRMQNIESTAQHALNMLRVFILNQKNF